MKKLISLLLTAVIVTSLSISAFAAQQTFTDVPTDFWAYDCIEQMFEEGVIAGTSYNAKTGERQFSPQNTLTMAQFITILTRGFYPGEVALYTKGGYTSPWYAAHKQTALNHKLFTGTSGVENLEKPITRYDMAAIMANVLEDAGFQPTTEQLRSVEKDIGDYSKVPAQYQKAVKTVFYLGIIAGTDEKGTFNGQAYMNRAQAAVVYCRLTEKINGLTGEKVSVTIAEPKTVDVFNIKYSDYKNVQDFADAVNAMTPAYREGYLTNGKKITNENILEFLGEIQKIIPQGTRWDGSNQYTYYTLKFGYAGGCASFAMLVSDWMFGEDAPLLRNQDFKNIQPGDFIWEKNASGTIGHFIVVMEVNGTNVRVCDGNRNSSVYWTTKEDLTPFLNNEDGLGSNSYVYYRY